MPVFCSTCRIAFRVERSAVCSWCRSHERSRSRIGVQHAVVYRREWRTMSERCTDETARGRSDVTCTDVHTTARRYNTGRNVSLLAECTRVLTSLPNQRWDSTGATYTVRRLLRCHQLLHCGGPAGPPRMPVLSCCCCCCSEHSHKPNERHDAPSSSSSHTMHVSVATHLLRPFNRHRVAQGLDSIISHHLPSSPMDSIISHRRAAPSRQPPANLP